MGAPSNLTAPTDGDTIKLDDGNSLRLWGVDAPELRQPGYLRDGSMAPVGEQSRKALADLMGTGDTLSGPIVMRSWGRPVAPVSIGGADAGQQMVRGGNAFAAPDYLSDDPNRRFNYMQAERLARLNRLGPLNDAFVQKPSEFRDAPKHIVPRQTVAQFYDTPTPRSGLSAEIEQGIAAQTYDDSVPVTDVYAYAKANGAILTPGTVEKARDHFLKTGDAGGLEYLPQEQILTDSGTGASGAAVRGFGQGFVAGGLDELGAVADTVIPSIPGFNTGRENVWNSDRRVADIWANNQRQNSSILNYDREFHPYASYGAEVGGALTSGFAIPFGQGARTIPQLARVGGAWGATEGFMGTDGEVRQRLRGAAIGAPLGAVVGAAGGKAIEVGAPVAGRAFNKVFGRGAQDAARGTGDAVGEFAEEGAQEAAQRSSQGEQWPGTPVAPQGRSVGMDAEPMPSVSGNIRRRDVIDVSPPTRPTPLDQPLTDAQRRAMAENVQPRDVLPEDAPFPPVQADADWPADAAGRAGNIDLAKLESPQDIRRALSQTNNRVGFDAATRGRVTQAETARLASELNMTPEKLLSRRKGQALNAEEALAARQLLAKSGNELVNAARRIKGLEDPGDQLLSDFHHKWMRHVAIQEQVSGMTAEAGRALQQFRMAANSREVRGDVLNAMVRGGGGKDNLTDAANVLLDAVEAGPGVFNAVAEKAAKPKWRDKIAEFYINSILSGPQTHAVNMTSNTLTAMAQLPEHAAAAAIGGVRQAFSRVPVDRVVATEVGQRAFGLLQGAKEGAHLFARALRTGDASDFSSKVEGQQYKAIQGIKGEVIRIPTRFLTAEDEFFKGIARRMELNGLAARKAHQEGLKGEAARERIGELVADPTDDMFERALDYGRYLTFQRKLGPLGQKVSGVTQENLVAKIFLPFVRTPTNLIKFAAERSPAAPLLKEWRADVMAGGSRRDLAIAKAAIGTGFGMVMYEAALQGRVTGSPPSDQKKARLLYADGWQPYSIKLGDQWYSFKRLDPFSTTIGVAADLATMEGGLSEKQREDKTTLLVASIMGNLASKTWLSGLSDLTEALTDPERYAGNLKSRLVASFLVPNFATQVGRTLDPVRRERDGVVEELRSRVPGLSDDLLPRRDIWGEEIRSGDNLGPDILSPFWVSRSLNDPVNVALLPLDYAPGYPSRTVGGRELTPEEYDRYSELAGKESHVRLSRLVTSPEWQALDYEDKTKAAKKIVSDAREGARDLLFSGGSASEGWPGQPIGGSSPEQWPGQPVQGASSTEQWPGQPVS